MRFVVSIRRDVGGAEMKLCGEMSTTRASFYVDDLGAGSPIATAGGQRGSAQVAGPFHLYQEARAEADRRESSALRAVDDCAVRFEAYSEEQREQAAFWRDDAARLARELDKVNDWIAERDGLAAGFAFRAEELRYDARGGMTYEQSRSALGLDQPDTNPEATARLVQDFTAPNRREER